MPCHAMLCYAMLCYAMLCYAMLCYAMLCYAMLCYAMLCYAMLCYAMLCYAGVPVRPNFHLKISRLTRFDRIEVVCTVMVKQNIIFGDLEF
jgi:hypothetical protein